MPARTALFSRSNVRWKLPEHCSYQPSRGPSHPGNKRLKITGFVTFSSHVFLCLRWRSDCPNSPLVSTVPSPERKSFIPQTTMKKLSTILTAFTFTALAAQAQTVVFSNDFGTGYTDGNLVGQNGWSQTSTAANNPVQVTSGQVVLPFALGGQDVWAPLSTAVTNTAGNYMLSKVNFSVTNATLAGDYFFNLSSPTNTSSAFFQRLWARTNVSGQLNFGLTVSSTNATTAVTWGSTAFTFNTTYNAVMSWDFISGASNDVVKLFIDQSGDIGTWTSEASVTWNSSTAEPPNLAAINLRQGSASITSGVLVNSLELQVVPEPSTYAMLALAGAGFAGYVIRRRRR